MIEFLIIYNLFILRFKNIINISYVTVLIFFILNLNYLNLTYFIDSIYIYILNYLLNLNYNIIILLIILNYINIKFKFRINTFIVLYILLEFINYNKLNSDWIYNLNSNLVNGFFLIHPILLYIYYSIFTIILFNSLSAHLNYNYLHIITNKLLINSNKLLFIITKLLFIILIAIFLGAWWAYQELSWGTWWNWDSIEIINLIYLLFIFNIQHKSWLFYIKNQFVTITLIFFKILLLFYMVRYSMVQSIHNFLNIELLNQYNIYIYIIFICYICLTLKKFYILDYKFIYSNYVRVLPISLFFIFILNFILNLNSVNILNFIDYFKNISIFILYSGISYYLISSINAFKNLFISANVQPITLFISFATTIFKSIRLYKFLHLNLIFILILILIFSFNIKLAYIINNTNNNAILIIQDKNLITEFLTINTIKFLNYSQSLLYLNTTIINDLNPYLSCSTQLSNSNYLLPNWLEFYVNKINKYLFIYIINFLWLQINISLNIVKTNFISKIYY